MSAVFPTAPLSSSAVEALRSLELALTSPEVQSAVARYRLASASVAKVSQVMAVRDLTGIEASDFEYLQDVMCEARSVIAAAGRLDLIGVAA
ncbi:hypothetical protein [Streptomyces sp. FxanaA7]|uniref:hypothetical protein n=1 Tax=Streptomyces sp. FxanaA7 TaxID=1265492 RepID=UPI0005ED89E4|nr:hypothetical protein [Streptomyces sp. FxanaA7]